MDELEQPGSAPPEPPESERSVASGGAPRSDPAGSDDPTGEHIEEDETEEVEASAPPLPGDSPEAAPTASEGPSSPEAPSSDEPRSSSEAHAPASPPLAPQIPFSASSPIVHSLAQTAPSDPNFYDRAVRRFTSPLGRPMGEPPVAATPRSSAPPPIPLVAKRKSSRPPEHTVAPHHLQLAKAIESQLNAGVRGNRLARLLVELGRITQVHLRDLPTAAFHFQRALRAMPDSLAAVQGARETLVALGRIDEAVPLYDAELKLISNPRQKSQLLQEKAALLEHKLTDIDAAEEQYRTAFELDRENAAVIAALARLADDPRRGGGVDRRELDRRLEQLAALAKGSGKERAALTVLRALNAEAQGDQAAAITLYEGALQDEPRARVALEALDRLYEHATRPRERSQILRRRAEVALVPTERAGFLLEAAALLDELGNANDAVDARVAAVQVAPSYVPALEDLIRSATQAGQWQRAADALHQLSSHRDVLEERRAQALIELGHMLDQRLGDENAAVSAYLGSLELRFDREPLAAARGVFERQGNWEQVFKLSLQEIEHTSDRTVQAHLLARSADIAETHLRDLARAAEQHRKSLAIMPASTDSVRALRRILARNEEWRDLVQVLEGALDHSTDAASQVAILLDIARVFEAELQDPSMAAHNFRRVLELEAGNMSALHGLERVSRRENRPDEQLKALDLEVEKIDDRDRLTQLLHRGARIAEEGANDRKEAQRWLKRALAVDATHQPTLRSLARVARANGRWEDVVETLEALAQITEGSARAHYYTEMSQIAGTQLGDQQRATQYARAAVTAAPTASAPFERLADTLRSTEQWTELATALQGRIDALADDASPEVRSELAHIRARRMGDAAAAIEALRAGTSSTQENAAQTRRLELLLEEQSEWADIDRMLWQRIVVDEAEDDDETIALAAKAAHLCLERLGDADRAAQYVEAGLSLDPEDPLLLRLRGRINQRAGETSTSLMTEKALAESCTTPSLQGAHLHRVAALCSGDAAALTVAEDLLRRDGSDGLAARELRIRAIRLADATRLSAASTQLAAIESDEITRGLHLTTVAELFEQDGQDDSALESFRGAFALDAENLAAVRGMSRIARRRDDPNLLAEAARCAAKVADEPGEAADLLTRSAQVRLDRLGDRDGARRDLERALEIAPGHGEAIHAIAALMESDDERADLIQLLSKAATNASLPARQRELWLEVASLQDASNNRAGAISALNRVLRTDAEDSDALLRLAQLYAADQQWNEAVNLLNQVIRTRPEREHLQQAHVHLARIWHEQLGDTDRARVSLRAVLALEPHNMDALSRLVRIHCSEGETDEARKLAGRLLEQAQSDAQRADAHLLMSEAEQLGRNASGAREHTLAALELEGPGGRADAAATKLLSTPAHYETYARSLSKYIERHATGGSPPEAAVLQLSDVWWNQLQNRDQALKIFRMTLPFTDTPKVRMTYARRLAETGDAKNAVRVLQELLARDLHTPDAWRMLAKIRAKTQGVYAQRLCAEVVRALGEGTPVEDEQVADCPPRKLPNVIANEKAWTVHFRSEGGGTALRAMLALIAPALPKIFPVSFDEYHLDPRDAARSEPAITLCGQLCRLLDLPPVSLRFHDLRGQGPSFAFDKAGTLYLPETMLSLPKPSLCFHMAKWLVAHRLGLTPVVLLTSNEVQALLVATMRLHDETYGQGTTSEDVLDRQSKIIGKALGRKGRKQAAEQATDIRVAGRILFDDWCRDVRATCDRIAAVLCDDLQAALEESTEPPETLLRFWTSGAAEQLRKKGAGFVES